MKGLLSLLSFLLLLSSCASKHPGLPEPFLDIPLAVRATELKKKCAAVYPQGKWQFVHTIEFFMADGRSSSVIGVTVLDESSLSCALMTVEGFTLFEARLTDRLEVDRAVPPFDRPGFATGLMEDVRALFLHPEVSEVRCGRLDDDTKSCRMTGPDGEVTDILPLENGCWQIKTYNSGQLIRTITARSCRSVDSTVIPAELELTVPGPAGYTLKMTLIDFARYPGENE